MSSPDAGLADLRSDLAQACRVPQERGLAWTTAEDVRLVTLDGEPGAAGELDGWSAPDELPLHTEVLRRRPDVPEAVLRAVSVDQLARLP